MKYNNKTFVSSYPVVLLSLFPVVTLLCSVNMRSILFRNLQRCFSVHQDMGPWFIVCLIWRAVVVSFFSSSLSPEWGWNWQPSNPQPLRDNFPHHVRSYDLWNDFEEQLHNIVSWKMFSRVPNFVFYYSSLQTLHRNSYILALKHKYHKTHIHATSIFVLYFYFTMSPWQHMFTDI